MTDVPPTDATTMDSPTPGETALSEEALAEARATLSSLALFGEMTPDQLEATCRRLTHNRFAPGQYLVRAREIGDSCYIRQF